MHVDASNVAVGAVLYQTREHIDGSIMHEAISFASKQFSEVDLSLGPIKKESYACFFGNKHVAYYHRCKPFILETDYRDVLFVQQFLNSFEFSLMA